MQKREGERFVLETLSAESTHYPPSPIAHTTQPISSTMNSNINAKSSIANPNDDVVDTVNAARPSSPPRVAVADGDGVSAADEDPPLPQAMSHLHANHQRASVPFLLHPSVPSGCFTNANVMVEVRDDKHRLHLQQHLVAPHPRDATQATGGLRFAPPEIPRAVEGMLRRPISPFCPPPCFNMKYRYFIPEADVAAVAAAAPFVPVDQVRRTCILPS